MDESLPRDLRTCASGNRTNSPPSVDTSQQSTTGPGIASPGQNPSAAPKGRLGTPYEITGHFSPRQDDFRLQNIASALLKGELNPKGKPYRVTYCARSVVSKERGVDVVKGIESGKAKYCGLQKCGSVWTCRACQRKITRVREREIQAAMTLHVAGGGSCLMITYTHGHKKHDPLKPLVDAYADAMSDMTSWRGYKKIIAAYDLDGRIRALETTFGWANGWHPHGHELHFRNGLALTEGECKKLKEALFRHWKKACKKHGLPVPSIQYGVDVRVAWSAAEYMAKFGSDQKWGAGKELTRLNSKRSDDDERFTPFDFLRAYDAGYKTGTMAVLFREYAHAYHGRRQLHWSDGLKARFGIEDLTDEEAEAIKEEGHAHLGNIKYDDWRRVIRERNDMRLKVLELCEQQGFAAAVSFIRGLAPTEFATAAGRLEALIDEWLKGAGGTHAPPARAESNGVALET